MTGSPGYQRGKASAAGRGSLANRIAGPLLDVERIAREYVTLFGRFGRDRVLAELERDAGDVRFRHHAYRRAARMLHDAR